LHEIRFQSSWEDSATPFTNLLCIIDEMSEEVAIEEAMFLSKLVNNVKVIHRRDKLRASRILEKKLSTIERFHFSGIV